MMRNRVKDLRLARGWTQEHLARKLLISRPYLSQIENGKRNIGITIMLRIASLFNKSVEEVFLC